MSVFPGLNRLYLYSISIDWTIFFLASTTGHSFIFLTSNSELNGSFHLQRVCGGYIFFWNIWLFHRGVVWFFFQFVFISCFCRCLIKMWQWNKIFPHYFTEVYVCISVISNVLNVIQSVFRLFPLTISPSYFPFPGTPECFKDGRQQACVQRDS